MVLGRIEHAADCLTDTAALGEVYGDGDNESDDERVLNHALSFFAQLSLHEVADVFPFQT